MHTLDSPPTEAHTHARTHARTRARWHTRRFGQQYAKVHARLVERLDASGATLGSNEKVRFHVHAALCCRLRLAVRIVRRGALAVRSPCAGGFTMECA